MEENISQILDLFPNISISIVERVLKEKNNNVDSTIDYLLNNQDSLNNDSVNNSNNLNNCGKSYHGNQCDNNQEFQTEQDIENERLFKEFMENEQLKGQELCEKKTFLCDICYSDLPITDFYILDECNHKFCNTCLKTHYTYQIKSGYSNLKCPANCKYIVSYEEAKHLLSGEIFQRYDQLLLNAHLRKDENILTCPFADCNMKMVSHKNLDSKYVECPNNECGFRFCIECRNDAHEFLTCAEYQATKRELSQFFEQQEESRRDYIQYLIETNANKKLFKKARRSVFFSGRYLKKRDENYLSKTLTDLKKTNLNSYNWIVHNTQVCPHCYNLVQKEDGCNHIDCICGGSFCFGCGFSPQKHKNAMKTSFPCSNYQRNFVFR